jgi:hypothetical protein
MLRLCSCAIALAVMLVGLPTAQAADTVLTLACQGTERSKGEERSEESNGLRDAASHEPQKILWSTT